MPPRQRTVFLCSRYVILYDERHFTIRAKPKSISRDWSFAVNFQQRPAKPLFAAKGEAPLARLVAFRGVADANTSRPSAQYDLYARDRRCPLRRSRLLFPLCAAARQRHPPSDGKATRRPAPSPPSPRQPHSPLPSICALFSWAGFTRFTRLKLTSFPNNPFNPV